MIKKWNIFYQKKRQYSAVRYPRHSPFWSFWPFQIPVFLFWNDQPASFQRNDEKFDHLCTSAELMELWRREEWRPLHASSTWNKVEISASHWGVESVESVESRNGVETIEVDESWGRPGRICFGTHREYPILTASSVRPLPRNISPVLHPQFPGHVWANGS